MARAWMLPGQGMTIGSVFFQAEHGIRDIPSCLEFRRVLFRSVSHHTHTHTHTHTHPHTHTHTHTPHTLQCRVDRLSQTHEILQRPRGLQFLSAYKCSLP